MARITLAALTLVGVVAACQPAQPELTEEHRLALIDTLMGVQRDMISAARAVDADAVLSFFDSTAGVIMGTEYFSYPRFAERVRSAYAAMEGQVVNWHPAKVSVISRDMVAMTLGGRAATIAAGDTSETVAVAWTEVLVRSDSGWKVLHAHQSTGSTAALQ